MQTRCPHCQTRFRVTTEQLKLRQGQVRCGACHAVFDALDSLSDESLAGVVPPPEPQATVPCPESQPLPDGSVSLPPVAVPVAAAAVIPVAAIEAAANETSEPEAEGASAPADESEPELEPEPEPEPEIVPEPAVDTEPAPEPVQDATIPDEPAPAEEAWQPVPVVKPVRRWPWAIGSATLLLAGLAQLAYLYRVELAVVAPATRPVLVAGCELLGCDLPRPRKTELIDFETSDLAPQGTGLLLTATLRNRAPFEQDYPHLELTLTDTQDAPLVRKVITPAEYLPAGQAPDAGFAARGTADIKLALATDNVPAVGYRLYFFYP